MFYCKVCQEKNKWPTSLAKSIGNCEVCGTRDLCNDVKSSNLPIIGKNDMKHTKGKIEVSSSNPNYIYVLKDGRADGLFAECDAGDYARSKEEGEANADELVRRWNAFEEGGLVDELRTALEAWTKVESEMRDNNPCPDLALRAQYRKEAVKLTEAALAKN